MRAIAILPARLASTRLPGKPLLKETGKFLIQHAWERATKARRVERVVVATDSDEIARACRGFGAQVVLTKESHPSGTDRCAEAYGKLAHPADLVLNVQGDEPEV